MGLVLIAKVHFHGDTAEVTIDVDAKERVPALMALATSAVGHLELAREKASDQALRETLSALASIRVKVPGGTDPGG